MDMFPELQLMHPLCVQLRARLDAVREDQGGYSSEAVVITALLVALAIAAGGIIVTKITDKANDISTE